MKPFLAIDLTTDKHNEKTNGEEYLSAGPSTIIEQSLARSFVKAEKG